MIPLKLSAIDQEHLQELYDAAGVARDELPYTDAFESIWQGFQDRTFKNASRDQVYAALLKYTRSSTNASKPSEAVPLTDEQKKLLKVISTRHATGGKILPYTDSFNSALKEFNAQAGAALSEQEFWRSLAGGAGGKRRPPMRKTAKVAKEAADDEDDGE
jgi:hypothetical protein